MPEGMLNSRERVAAVLRHFYERGYTLRDCLHPHRMGNFKLATLIRHAKKNGIFFKDLDECQREVDAVKKK